MRRAYTQLYLHMVWATWDRLPLIATDIEARLYAAIADKCREHQCVPLAIGGVPDHVHVLLQLDATVAVATLVKELKGSSSHLVTHEIAPGKFFKWQGAYAAVTLRPDDVPTVESYIAGQKERHALGALCEEWEQTLTTVGEEPR